MEEIRERERDMLDLSSEDGWQWSKFRIGKHARQDPNDVRRHGMVRLPGGVAQQIPARRWRRPRAVRAPLVLAPT